MKAIPRKWHSMWEVDLYDANGNKIKTIAEGLSFDDMIRLIAAINGSKYER